jgi:hypothetical protein
VFHLSDQLKFETCKQLSVKPLTMTVLSIGISFVIKAKQL